MWRLEATWTGPQGQGLLGGNGMGWDGYLLSNYCFVSVMKSLYLRHPAVMGPSCFQPRFVSAWRHIQERNEATHYELMQEM